MSIQMHDIIPRYKQYPSRKMNLTAMEQDFTYEIAQIITTGLFEKGLISEREYGIIRELNIENFVPFYAGIL